MLNDISNRALEHPWLIVFTALALYVIYEILFGKRAEAPFVDVGRAELTVSFDGELPDIKKRFDGYAFWLPAFHPDSVINYDAASLAVDFINSPNPVKLDNGSYVPRARVVAYHMTVEPLILQATK